MTQNTWQYQGRQLHGEWGHGTAPHTEPPSRPGRINPPAPASLAGRASYVAFGAIAYLAREMARQYELRLQHGMLDDLCKLLAASPAAAHLSDAIYCQHLLGDQIGLDATHSLRRAAAIIPTAPTLDDLEPGTVALSDAVKTDGLPRFARAMQAAANAGPVPPKPGPMVDHSTALGFAATASAITEAALPALELGAGAVVAPVGAFLWTLLHPSHTADNDTLYDRDHPYGPNVFSKPPKDDKPPPKKNADEGTSAPLEETPSTKPDNFEPVRGRDAKRNKKTGEIWVKDKMHKDHYEVYKDKKRLEKRERDRDVWLDGRPKRKL